MKNKIIEAIVDEEKTYLFPRLLAYVIDMLLVYGICLGIVFALPVNKNHQKYVDEYTKIQTEYFLEKNMSQDEYINKSKDVVYDIDYTNTLSTLSEVVVLTLYFVVFQYYNKGQTIGKKLMKLKVISTKDKELNINQLAIRSLIANSIMINLLLVTSVLFLGRNYYYYASMGLQIFNYTIIIIALLMIIFRRDGKGLHDLVTNTKVVYK